MPVLFDARQSCTHRGLERVVGDEHKGRRRALLGGRALHDALDRYLFIRKDAGNGRNRTRLVVELERHVVAALVDFPFALAVRE